MGLAHGKPTGLGGLTQGSSLAGQSLRGPFGGVCYGWGYKALQSRDVECAPTFLEKRTPRARTLTHTRNPKP